MGDNRKQRSDQKDSGRMGKILVPLKSEVVMALLQ